MPAWRPISRRALVATFRRLRFSGPKLAGRVERTRNEHVSTRCAARGRASARRPSGVRPSAARILAIMAAAGWLALPRVTRDHEHPRRPQPPHHATATTGRWRCRRTSSACGRRRTAARRSRPTRCKIAPATHFINWQQDPFGNYLARLVFPEPTTRAVDRGRPDRRHDGDQPVRLLPRADDAEHYPVPLRASARARARAVPRDAASAARGCSAGSPASTARRGATVDFLVELNQRLQRDIGYSIRMEPGVQTLRGDAGAARAARAATPAGCWCRSCATSASPRASSPAT